MHVARRAHVVHRPLRHERRGAALLRRNLLDAVLEDEMTVGRDERLVVDDVHLVLAPPRLALGDLDRDAGGAHLVADATQDVLLACRLQQLVVLDGRGVRRQAPPPLGVGLLEGLLEEEELELGRAAHPQAALGRPLQLAAQDLAGRHLDRRPVLVGQVADDEGGAFEPRDQAGRGVVGPADEVAVAGVPVREAVARERVHVDVHRQEVVARLDPVLGHVRPEEVRRHPLPHGPPVHVGERHARRCRPTRRRWRHR